MPYSTSQVHATFSCKGAWELLFERKRALTYPFFTLFFSQFFSFLFLNPGRQYGKGLFERAHYVLYTALHICRQVPISSYRRKWEKQQSSLYIYTTRETKSSTYIAWHRLFCPNYLIMESGTNKFWWKCPITNFSVFRSVIQRPQNVTKGRAWQAKESRCSGNEDVSGNHITLFRLEVRFWLRLWVLI